jgi:hypothetical protein
MCRTVQSPQETATMTTESLPFGLKRFKIRVNWPVTDFGYSIVAKNADQAWVKFCQQQFKALKPDRSIWSITEESIAS